MRYINTLFTLIITAWFAVPCLAQSSWSPVGPLAFPVNQSGQINGIGRVSQLKFDPVTANKIYAVAPHGLFVSVDNANHWSATGTDALPSSTGCASVCVDRTNSNILYLGTGDRNYYSTSSGVWKSVDGGATFNQSNTGMGNRLVVEILQSPVDANTLVAATENGIYKTTDGGANWVQTLVGAIQISDMRMNTAPGSTTIYAVGRTNGVFYSSADMGSAWNSLTVEAVTPGSGSRLSVSPADPGVVYINFIGSNSATGGGIIYRSADGGATFSLRKGNVLPNLNGYTANTSGQGNYNYDMEADPLDANTLYVCGHLIWKSTDGGITWVQKQATWSQVLHTDQHGLRFNPYNLSQLFNVNDGGVWLNTDKAETNTWTPVSNGLEATEFYHMANGRTQKYYIGGGTQDNGELYFKTNTWYTNRGGDFDWNYAMDNSTTYAYYVPRIASSGKSVRRDNYNSPTSSALTLNLPRNANSFDRFVFSAQDANTGFAKQDTGGIYRTVNLQTQPPVWTNIWVPSTPTMRGIAISPADANFLYVILKDKSIYKTVNALAAVPVFTAMTPAPLPVSATNSSGGFAVLKNGIVYMFSDGYVFRSADEGATWTPVGSGSVTTTLNTQAPIISLITDTTHENLESLYALTMRGVYYKDNTMTDWIYFEDNNLPSIARYTDMDIFYDASNLNNSLLRVSTYGRGTWESPLANNVMVNQLPLVSITAPFDGQGFNTGSNIALQANATDPDGFITKVEYFANSIKIGESVTGPFSTSWNAVPNGNYALTAIAYDNLGAIANSSVVNIIVGPMVVVANLPSVGDSYVRDGGSGNSNFGTIDNMVVKKDGVGFSRESFVQFDLNTLPANTKSAKLKLNVVTANTAVTSTIWQVYFVPTDTWNETTITWNNKPARTTLLATINGAIAGTTVEWDVSQQTLTELAGDKKISFNIISTVTGSTTDGSFATKEHATAAIRPELVASAFSGTLPLTLLSFKAELKNNLVNLYWVTTDETNVASFEIEQSEDGRAFSSITSVTANNLPGTNRYSAVVPAPQNGVLYYRIKMIDKDGRFEYSGVAKITRKGDRVFIYPNPVSSRLYFNYSNAQNNASAELYSIDGKKLMSIKLGVNSTQASFDVSGLKNGSYFLTLRNGEVINSIKFIKQ